MRCVCSKCLLEMYKNSDYSSCDKGIEPGEYYKNKIVFMSETAQMNCLGNN